MNKDKFLLSADQRPGWLVYPPSFCRIVEEGLIHMTPWHIFDAEGALARFKGLSQRFPARELFPFAYKQDTDDVACWEKGSGEKVMVIHDFTSPGFENQVQFDDVWAWLRDAIDDFILWD